MSKRPSVDPDASRGVVDTEYYPFVDGLRGLAILAVIAVHASQTAGAPWRSAVLSRLAASGARGVQLFFILSAFTLFSTSFQRFAKEHSPRRNFYLRRAFRILPLWWASVAIFSLIHAASNTGFGHPVTALDIVLQSTFLFGFAPTRINSIVPGGWSLFCEETFYLLLPLLYARVKSLRAAASLTVWLIGLAVGWYGLSHLLMPHDAVHEAFSFFFPFSQWFIFGYGFILFFGLKATGPTALSGPVLLFADAVVAIMLWSTLAGVGSGPAQFAASTAFLGLCFCVSQQGSFWRRAIDRPLLRVFGKCCYSIYLLHFMVIHAALKIQPRLFQVIEGSGSSDVRFIIWFVLVGSGCLILGLASFHLFERPAVRLGIQVRHEAIRGADVPVLTCGQLVERWVVNGEAAVAAGRAPPFPSRRRLRCPCGSRTRRTRIAKSPLPVLARLAVRQQRRPEDGGSQHDRDPRVTPPPLPLLAAAGRRGSRRCHREGGGRGLSVEAGVQAVPGGEEPSPHPLLGQPGSGR